MPKTIAVLMLVVAAAAASADLVNGDFEAPALEPWVVFQSEGVTPRMELTGQPQVLKMQASGPAKGFAGVYQTQPARAGQRYQFTVLTKVTETGVGRGQISLEWLSDDNREIGRVWGPHWPLNETDRVWQEHFVRGTAPEGATQLRVVVTLFFDDEAGATGVVLVDDATLTKP
ncbi:MAG: hypothetical protein NZ483_04335 [Verrucomicrobiae bacterium]|nr:hypothetical protein [Verrucomicrobiae bacterium]MDW8345174.1 hypothetical protein [Verrucomicrobiae bacterium]